MFLQKVPVMLGTETMRSLFSRLYGAAYQFYYLTVLLPISRNDYSYVGRAAIE